MAAEDELRRLDRLKTNLKRRAEIFHHIRTFFREQDFLEVDTPVRVPSVAPELNIIPFDSEGWSLSTSPELYMKRLLAAGYERLFQFSHCFRKGERGRWHNPEFIMLEWYRSGADYRSMIQDTEGLVVMLARELRFGSRIEYQGSSIDLSQPWQSETVRNAFLKTTGWDPVAQPDPLRFDTDLVTRVLPSLPPERPAVLMDYPASMGSLARLKPGDPAVAERAEVFIGGLEIANAYSELNDVEEQRKRFLKELEEIQREQHRRAPLPERFLEVLPHLPPCGGIALGLDRLVMLFCDAASIDEVMPFTIDTA